MLHYHIEKVGFTGDWEGSIKMGKYCPKSFLWQLEKFRYYTVSMAEDLGLACRNLRWLRFDYCYPFLFYRLGVFLNRVLRKIFGPKRIKVIGEWRERRKEELNDLHSPTNIIRVFLSWMRWAGHVAVGGDEMYTGFCYGNVRGDLGVDGRIILKLTFKKWDREHWLNYLRIETDGSSREWGNEHPGLNKAVNFLSSSGTAGLSRRILQRGVNCNFVFDFLWPQYMKFSVL